MYHIHVTEEAGKTNIDIYIRNSIRGYFVVGNKVYPNRLLKNFYALLWGILTDTYTYMRDVWGNERLMHVCGDTFKHARGLVCTGDIAFAEAVIATCEESNELGFNAYVCNIVDACLVSEVKVSGSCVEYGCAIGTGGNSIMTFFILYDSQMHIRPIAIAHKAISVAGGQTVKHRICFDKPWNSNIAAAIAAIACDCGDIVATDLLGSQYYLPGMLEITAQPAEIAVASDGVIMRTYTRRFAYFTNTHAFLHFEGLINPLKTIILDKIILLGKFFDPACKIRVTPVLEAPVETPEEIVLKAGELYSIGIHIVGE